MPITLSDFLTFPFNGGKGIRTKQLWGEFVKKISGDGAVTQQGADGMEVTVSLEDIVGAIGSNASVRVVHASNVVIGRPDTYVDAGFDWPELIPFLLVQWNPAGNSQHRSFAVVYNPRIGRFPGDVTGLTNAAVGDTPDANNSTGYAVPHGIAVDATRAITAAQADFGKTAANRALLSCSDETLAPTPLVVLAVTPSQVGVGPAKERIIRPAGRFQASAGVRNMVLPEDYADFEMVEWGILDPGNEVTDFVQRSTAWLAAQEDADGIKIGVVDDDEAGSRQFLTWTPSTRAVGTGSQSTATGTTAVDILIVSCRLYDTSVTTDAPEGGGLTDAQAAKLARYPENPAATPAAHLEPYALIGAYESAAYVELEFDTFNIDPGEIMVSPSSQGGARHGVLIGVRPEDSDVIDYAEVGLSLRLFDTSDDSVAVAGMSGSVSSHANGTVLLVSISDHTVNSFATGTNMRVEFGNKIAAMIASIDISSQGVDQAARDSAGEALRLAQANASHAAETDKDLIDIDRVRDGATWQNAPAAEAQFAITPTSSDLGQKLSLADHTAIDPATDLAGLVWRTTLNPVPDESQVIVRIKRGLSSLPYSLNHSGFNAVVQGYQERVTAADWDYYEGGGYGGGALAIQKRTEAYHTDFHGSLSGRALDQVEAGDANLQEQIDALVGIQGVDEDSVEDVIAGLDEFDPSSEDLVQSLALVRSKSAAPVAVVQAFGDQTTFLSNAARPAGALPDVSLVPNAKIRDLSQESFYSTDPPAMFGQFGQDVSSLQFRRNNGGHLNVLASSLGPFNVYYLGNNQDYATAGKTAAVVFIDGELFVLFEMAPGMGADPLAAITNATLRPYMSYQPISVSDMGALTRGAALTVNPNDASQDVAFADGFAENGISIGQNGARGWKFNSPEVEAVLARFRTDAEAATRIFREYLQRRNNFDRGISQVNPRTQRWEVVDGRAGTSISMPPFLTFDALRAAGYYPTTLGMYFRLSVAGLLMKESDNDITWPYARKLTRRPVSQWRPLAGASPYTVRATDQEFLVVLTKTDGANVAYIKETLEKVLLTQAARRFPFVEANPANANFNSWIGVSASINAAGTSLTVAGDEQGGAEFGNDNYALASVFAR